MNSRQAKFSKVVKIRFYRWYNALLTSLLTFLGYGCSLEEPMDMYGTPTADYQVKGVVTDEDGSPIKGIQIGLKFQEGKFIEEVGSATTDGQGTYLLETKAGFLGEDDRFKLIFEDVDGVANGGEFQSDTLTLSDYEAKKVKEGQGWNVGTYEIKADAKLKKK